MTKRERLDRRAARMRETSTSLKKRGSSFRRYADDCVDEPPQVKKNGGLRRGTVYVGWVGKRNHLLEVGRIEAV